MTEPPTKFTIILDSFTCNHRHESKGGGDDLYITYKIDGGSRSYRYPAHGTGVTDLSERQSWNLDYHIEFSESLVVSLYDQDTFPQPDDFLGSTTFRPGDDSHEDRILIGDDGEYKLSFHWASEEASEKLIEREADKRSS